MIKGKAAYPFETIALAVAFSPRLEALIAETKRLAELFDTKTVFIHVGKRTSDKDKHLSSLLLNYGFNDTNCVVHWQDGNPVETILSVCKNHVVDLLLIGALEKENMLKYYMGSISREISRRAKCSVMMITEPRIHPHPAKNIVVNGHEHAKTVHTINTAIYFAEREGVNEILVVDEFDMPALSMSIAEDSTESETVQIKNGTLNELSTKLSSLIDSVDKKNIDVKLKTISGRSGYTIGQFAQNTKADLLVVNSPDHHLTIFDRIFSHDLEYVLADLPCNMLIVHSRVF
jgi:nucleotide-binding universal stress UspA family protein